MAAIFIIRDWAHRFENNRSRELKHLDWVPVPNRQDGDAYTYIMSRKDGAALYGAWMAIVQVASRCDPRGTLLRDNGKPHDSTSLSRMTRMPEATISEMLKTMSSEDVMWLEHKHLNGTTEDAAGECDISTAGECDNEGKGREGKGIAGERAADAERPSLDEVKFYAQTIGLAEWKACDWFDEMEGCCWLDYQHRPIGDWRAVIRRVRTKWEADGRPMAPPSNAKATGRQQFAPSISQQISATKDLLAGIEKKLKAIVVPQGPLYVEERERKLKERAPLIEEKARLQERLAELQQQQVNV